MKLRKWMIGLSAIGAMATVPIAVISCTSSKGTLKVENGYGEMVGKTDYLFKVSFDKQKLSLKLKEFKGDYNKALGSIIDEMKLSIQNKLPDSVKSGEYLSGGPFVENNGFEINFYYPVKSILNSTLKTKEELKTELTKFINEGIDKKGERKYVFKQEEFDKYIASSLNSLIIEKSKEKDAAGKLIEGSVFLQKYFDILTDRKYSLKNGDYAKFDFKGFTKDELTIWKALGNLFNTPTFASQLNKQKAKDLIKNDNDASHLYEYNTKSKWDKAVDNATTDAKLNELVNSQPWLKKFHFSTITDYYVLNDADKKTAKDLIKTDADAEKRLKTIKTKKEFDQKVDEILNVKELKEFLVKNSLSIETLIPKIFDNVLVTSEVTEKIKGLITDDNEARSRFSDIKTKKAWDALVDEINTSDEAKTFLEKHNFVMSDITSAKDVSPALNAIDKKAAKDLVKDNAAAKKLSEYKSKEYWDSAVDKATTLANLLALLDEEKSLKMENFTSIYSLLAVTQKDKDAVKALIKDDKEAGDKISEGQTKKIWDEAIDGVKNFGELRGITFRYGLKIAKYDSLVDFSKLTLNSKDIKNLKDLILNDTEGAKLNTAKTKAEWDALITDKTTVADIEKMLEDQNKVFDISYVSRKSTSLLSDKDKKAAKELITDDNEVKKLKGFEKRKKSDWDNLIQSKLTLDELEVLLYTHKLSLDTYDSTVEKNPYKFTDANKVIAKALIANDEEAKMTKSYKTKADWDSAIDSLVTFNQFKQLFQDSKDIRIVKVNSTDKNAAKALIKDDQAAISNLKTIKSKAAWDSAIDSIVTLTNLKKFLASQATQNFTPKLTKTTSSSLIKYSDVVKEPTDSDQVKTDRVAPTGLDLSNLTQGMKNGDKKVIDLKELDKSYTKMGYYFWSKLLGNVKLYKGISSIGDTQNIGFMEVKKDDQGNLTYALFKRGSAFSGGSAKNHIFKTGASGFIDGFDKMMLGMKIGEKRVILPTFPKDYNQKDLAGKEVLFEITLNQVGHLKDLDTTDFIKEKVLKSESLKNTLEKFGFADIKDMAMFVASSKKQYVDNLKEGWYNQFVIEISKDLDYEFPKALKYNIASNMFNNWLKSIPQTYWQYVIKQRADRIKAFMSTSKVDGKDEKGQALVVAGQIETPKRYAQQLKLEVTKDKDGKDKELGDIFKEYIKEAIKIYEVAAS